MDQIITYVLFTHAMALMICAVLQLTLKIRSRVNNLMALFFFILGCLFFYFWSYRTNVIFRLPFLMNSDLAITFIIGPVGYAYVKNIIGEEMRFSIKNSLQYLPAMFVFFFFIIYHATGNTTAENGGNLYPDYHSDTPVYIISILADTWFLIYTFLVVIKIYRLTQSEKFRLIKEIRVIFYIFTAVALSCMFLFLAHLLKNDFLIGLVLIANGGFAVIYFLYSYRHPEYTQMIIKEPKGSRKPITLPVTVNLPRVMEYLITSMETENLYRNPAISIQSLSNLLGINRDHLSLILNEKLGVNFRTFINRYRLEEAQKLLVEDNEKSVLEIAFFVGFNSKSAFNTIFAKTTGLTPTKYRRKYF
ncbi:MAG: AraC family transcriptional regulator [Spirochaetes bacterium]|nr:AraC family transcriptional regulator [Spirochaetota bacterium]